MHQYRFFQTEYEYLHCVLGNTENDMSTFSIIINKDNTNNNNNNNNNNYNLSMPVPISST